MPATATAREKISTISPSMTQSFLDRVAATPSREAFRAPTSSGGWKSQTWKETSDDVTDLAAGLISLGLESEQRVGIASETNLEWMIADFAIVLAGGATTTVYSSTGAEDVAYILSDSNTRVLFAQNQTQVDKV